MRLFLFLLAFFLTSTAYAQTIDQLFDVRIDDAFFYNDDVANLIPESSADYAVDKMIYDPNLSRMVGGGTHGTEYITLIQYFMEPQDSRTTFGEFDKVYYYDLNANKKPTRVVSLMSDSNYYYMLAEYTLGTGEYAKFGSTILKIEKRNPNHYEEKDLSTIFMTPQYDASKSLKGGFAELSVDNNKIIGSVTQVKRTFVFVLSTSTLMPTNFGRDQTSPEGRVGVTDGIPDGYTVIDMPKGGNVGARVNGGYVIFTKDADPLGNHYAVFIDRNGFVKNEFNDAGKNYRTYHFAEDDFSLVGVKYNRPTNQIIIVGTIECSNKILISRLRQNNGRADIENTNVIEEDLAYQHAITVADFVVRPESGIIILFGKYTIFEMRPPGYGFYTSEDQIENDLALGADVFRIKNAYVAVIGNDNEMINLGTSTAITSDFLEKAYILTRIGISYNAAGFTAGATYSNNYLYMTGLMDNDYMPFVKVEYTPPVSKFVR